MTTSEYRYRLTRSDPQLPWLGDKAGHLLWIMLNPSTADDTRDDPTIRRVQRFTRRLGFPGLVVVNLYALRATRPVDLWAAADPVGVENDDVIAAEAQRARAAGAPVVAAWGVHARAGRVAAVLAIPHIVERLYCLGVTRSGAPRHPLYLPSDAPLARWPSGPEATPDRTGKASE